MGLTHTGENRMIASDHDRHVTTNPDEHKLDHHDGYYVELTGARSDEFIGSDVGEDYVDGSAGAYVCNFETFDDCERFLNNLSYWAKNRGLVPPRAGLSTTAGNVVCRQFADGSGSVVILAEAFERKG